MRRVTAGLVSYARRGVGLAAVVSGRSLSFRNRCRVRRNVQAGLSQIILLPHGFGIMSRADSQKGHCSIISALTGVTRRANRTRRCPELCLTTAFFWFDLTRPSRRRGAVVRAFNPR